MMRAYECSLSERVDAQLMRKIFHGRLDKKAVLAIGPEGGWTDGEFEAARAGGFVEASLGRLILRTETAVISALSALNFALGED